MRGLVQFIADLRNARARELEEKRINKELANIRQKFKSEKLDGYQKKKYVCKLLYIYIQGYDVDFGHLEAVNLISASKYSEKQIGYLAVTLFLHEQHELLHLVVNSIRKDLLDRNELNNSLALHAVANVGGREMGEALSADVHRLLISPTSKSFVKKKAALTLLRLYRKHPAIIQREWAERIVSLMDDPDMGVVLSVTSLVMALIQDNPEAYKGSYVKAAQIVIENDVSPDYLYYKVPCPWIQVKFLKLLQYYPASGVFDLYTAEHADNFSRRFTRPGHHSRVPPSYHASGDRNTKKCTTEQRSECRALRSNQSVDPPRHGASAHDADILQIGQVHPVTRDECSIPGIGCHDPFRCQISHTRPH